jgi:hypothetical protein
MTRQWREMGEECVPNASRKPGLAHQLVMLLSLGGATYRRLPASSLFVQQYNL